MTTRERIDVRGALIAAGFVRQYSDPPNPNHYDSGNGVYTEVWRSTIDRTLITVEWDRKET